MKVGLAILFVFMINVGIIVLIFFAIKYFIRYANQLKREKSQQQDELDRMNIDDL